VGTTILCPIAGAVIGIAWAVYNAIKDAAKLISAVKDCYKDETGKTDQQKNVICGTYHKI